MVPPPWTDCKFYLEGRCRNGSKCKYRHNVPGLVVKQQVPMVDNLPDSTTAVLVDGHIEAAIAAGGVPKKIVDLRYSERGLQLERIETSIQLKWFNPGQEIHFRFKSEAAAQRAYDRLHQQKNYGQATQANLVPDARNGDVFTVKLTKVPCPPTASIILGTLPPDIQHDLDGEPYTAPRQRILDYHDISDFVAGITEQHPIAIQEAKVTDNPGPLSRQVKIRFSSHLRLDRAAKSLNERKIPGFERLEFRAWEKATIHLKLNTSIYDRFRGLLKKCASIQMSEQNVLTHIDDEGRLFGEYVTIRMSSSSRDALMAAKRAFEKIIMNNILPLRCKPCNQTHRVRLTRTTNYVEAVHNGGLKKAQEILGETYVYLDAQSDPPAIVVRGDANTLRKAKRCLFPSQAHGECGICFEKELNIIEIEGCNHIVCGNCLDQYCTTEIEAKLPLRCFQTDCDNLLPMDQLKRELKKDSFLQLASGAIENCYRQKPEEHIKCPGPDCTLYLPTNKESNENHEHDCPGCFTTICTRCKVEYHFGKSCEAYQAQISEGEVRQMVVREGGKECPRCKLLCTKMQDTCNNTTCDVCRQHFCWICLKMFNTHGAVYEHLAGEHGGYFDNEIEANNANERVLAGYRARGGWGDEPPGPRVGRPRAPLGVELQQRADEQLDAAFQRAQRRRGQQNLLEDRELARELQEMLWLEGDPF